VGMIGRKTGSSRTALWFLWGFRFIFASPAPPPVHSPGIPAWQVCRGPVAYRPGVPSSANQNTEYVFDQREAFGSRSRASDIHMPMRTIAVLLTEDERRALAEDYDSSLGHRNKVGVSRKAGSSPGLRRRAE
jgi:hypothetical protein